MIYNNFIIFTTDIDQSTLELFDAEPIVDESEDETIDPEDETIESEDETIDPPWMCSILYQAQCFSRM